MKKDKPQYHPVNVNQPTTGFPSHIQPRAHCACIAIEIVPLAIDRHVLYVLAHRLNKTTQMKMANNANGWPNCEMATWFYSDLICIQYVCNI